MPGLFFRATQTTHVGWRSRSVGASRLCLCHSPGAVSRYALVVHEKTEVPEVARKNLLVI